MPHLNAARLLVCGLLMGAAACAPVGSAPPLKFAVQGASSVDEHDLAADLVSHAYETLRSAEFRRNLLSLRKSHPTVFARRHEQDLPLEQVVELSAAGRYFPVRIVLAGSDPNDEDYEIAGAAGVGHPGGAVRIRIGRGVLADYRSIDLVERSCAINTMAHELTHAISRTPVIFSRAFQDTRRGDERIPGRRDPTSAVASYLIGSVAQCTWLQQQGRITHGGFSDCVRVFGARSFNFRRCDAFPGSRGVHLTLDTPDANSQL